MSESWVIIAQFCDDVRCEVGSKYSLMGCYGDELIANKLPAVLSKLYSHIRVITPIDQPFSKLVLRAILDDDTIAEIDVPCDQIQVHTQKPEPRRWTIILFMAFSPLVIEKPCLLRIEAETEEGVLYGGLLCIRERTPDDPKL